MNILSGVASASPGMVPDNAERFAPKIKPDVDRVRANPFFPTGMIPRTTEEPIQRFEANLPGQPLVRESKIGTVLNTFA